MRYFLISTLVIMIACNQQAQESNQETDKQRYADTIPITMKETHITEFDKVKIDTVAAIPKGTNERSVAFIKKRLQALAGNYLKEKCIEHQLSYPPKFILFRFFKKESEFEVWAGNSNKDSLCRILFFNICAVDNVPGPKLEEGDGKTPEGFYHAPIYYGSTADFMWIKLNNKEISTYGRAGYGSSFKLCLNYPNSLDRLKTKTVLKHSRPGSAICIHANCVSIGCISFVNKDYLPVFLAAMGHNKAYGSIKIHIFPFRFDNYTREEQIKLSKADSRIKSTKVLEDWSNLKEGYDLFNKHKKAIKFSIQNNKYTFSEH